MMTLTPNTPVLTAKDILEGVVAGNLDKVDTLLQGAVSYKYASRVTLGWT